MSKICLKMIFYLVYLKENKKIQKTNNDVSHSRGAGLGLDSPDLTQLRCVEDWLAGLKMSRYLDNFSNAGLTEMATVARLSQRDLTQLGITLVGHQKKILQSIMTLRTQYAVNMSDGFLV